MELRKAYQSCGNLSEASEIFQKHMMYRLSVLRKKPSTLSRFSEHTFWRKAFWFAQKVLHKFTSKCVPNDGVIFQDIHCKFLLLSYTIPWNEVKLEFKTARRARNLPSCNGEWCRSWMDLASTALSCFWYLYHTKNWFCILHFLYSWCPLWDDIWQSFLSLYSKQQKLAEHLMDIP